MRVLVHIEILVITNSHGSFPNAIISYKCVIVKNTEYSPVNEIISETARHPPTLHTTRRLTPPACLLLESNPNVWHSRDGIMVVPTYNCTLHTKTSTMNNSEAPSASTNPNAGDPFPLTFPSTTCIQLFWNCSPPCVNYGGLDLHLRCYLGLDGQFANQPADYRLSMVKLHPVLNLERTQSLSSGSWACTDRERHTRGLMVRPMERREALGVTDSRSSSDEESTNLFVSPFRVEKLVFKENMSLSWLVTTRLGSSRLLDFLVAL